MVDRGGAGGAGSGPLGSVRWPYKDVLGKTVSKSRRGGTTGLAGSLSAVGVILFSGILLAFGASIGLLVPAIALAGVLWIAAAALFTPARGSPRRHRGRRAAG